LCINVAEIAKTTYQKTVLTVSQGTITHDKLSGHVEIFCRVAKKSATSRCNGLRDMTRHNRHNAPICYKLVMDLQWESYGETSAMDLGKTCYGDVANLEGKSSTCYGLATGNWCNGF